MKGKFWDTLMDYKGYTNGLFTSNYLISFFGLNYIQFNLRDFPFTANRRDFGSKHNRQ